MKANEVKVDIPILPSHGGSLDEIPADVKKRWAEKYEAAYRAAAVNGNADNFIHSIALSEANKLLAVLEPADYREAAALPRWQLMLRKERSYADLPHHLKRRVDHAPKYLHVVTTDGKEYAFPIPEEKGAKA